MQAEEFNQQSPGNLVTVTTPQGLQSLSFVPDILPVNFNLTPRLSSLAEEASFALGNLSGVGARLSNPLMFAQPFLRQEAVASTRIEGTRTDLQQLVLFEAENTQQPNEDDDNRETLNYVRALMSVWDSPERVVMSTHGINALHQGLMNSVRGANKNPGRLRTIPVFIGGAGTNISSARFVPPPPHLVPELLENLISNADVSFTYSRLIQLSILHYQFETIHPFEDGNGRTGRLMIALYLRHWGLLDQPMLSISAYFERNRNQYINHLYRVSTEGAWEDWIEFFLTGLRDQSVDTAAKAHRILDIQDQLRQTYQKARSPHILPILEIAFSSIAVTVEDVEPLTRAKKSTLYGIFRKLEDDGVMRKVPIRKGKNAYILIPLADVFMRE